MAGTVLGNTAGAVIFDNNRINNAIDTGVQAIQKQEQARIAQQQKQAQALARSWTDNALKASEGQLWGSEVAKLEEDHLRKGEELARRGIRYDSFSPEMEEYKADRRRIQAIQGFRKAKEAEYKNIVSNITKGDGTYDDADISKLNDFIQNGSIEKMFEEGGQLPQVRKKFSLNDALKGYKAPIIETEVTKNGNRTTETTVDVNGAENAILSRISASPRGEEFIQTELTGGYPLNVIKNLPSDPNQVKQLIKDMYASNPQVRESIAVQSNGTVTGPESVGFEEVIDQYANGAIQARDNYDTKMDDYISQSSGGIRTGKKVRPDYAESREKRAAENQQLRRNAEYRSQVRFNERNNPRPGSETGESSEGSDATIPYRSKSGGKTIEVSAPANNARRINIPSKTVSVNEYLDLGNGGKITRGKKTLKGNISMIADVPVVRGNVDAISQKKFADENPDKVEWRKMALMSIKDGDITKDIMVPIESLPENLTKDQAKIVNSFKSKDAGNEKASTNTKQKTEVKKKKIDW